MIKEDIRKEVVAGSFYPSSKRELYNAINDLKIDRSIIGDLIGFIAKTEHPIRALISPHAGITYSGIAAKTGYYIIKKSFDYYNKELKHVILIGPNHTGIGLTSVSMRRWKTPFGVVDNDEDISNIIGQYISVDEKAHEYEHSLEMQLIFLQYFFDKFKISPIIISSSFGVDNLSNALSDVVAYLKEKGELDNSLFIVSSDFTHYGYNYGYVPFNINDKIREKIKEIDLGAIKYIKGLNPKGFIDYIKHTKATICGYLAIYGFLLANKKARIVNNVKLASYYMSGDLNKDYEMSVSYASILMW